MKRISIGLVIALTLFLAQVALAGLGPLFRVSASGTPSGVSITLCLNAKGPLSCQNYTVSALSLNISSTAFNHTYPFAGIKINTPGYTLANPGVNCTPYGNGYCLFSLSNSAPKTITISNGTDTIPVSGGVSVGGSITGLTASGLVLQNNSSDNLSVSANASTFQFATQIAAGGSYNVTIATQPTGLVCAVSNGSGINVTTNINSIVVTCITAQYVYVADSTGYIYQCSLNANGTFNACAVTPSGASSFVPNDLTFAIVNGTQYAYVTNNNTNVLRCTLNTNGTFNTCTQTPTTGSPLTSPYGIAFATISSVQYGYVANTGNKKIFRCTLNANGTFNTCTATPSSGAPAGWVPFSLTFATVNGTQYAYVTSVYGTAGTDGVYQCTLNTDGSFNTCAKTPAIGAPAWTPLGITVTTINGAQYAYVLSLDDGNAYQCTFNSDGSFNVCIITPSIGAPSWIPRSAVFVTAVNGVSYAYVTDDNGNIYQCTLNTNGTFNSCTVTPASSAPAWFPDSVAVMLTS